MFNAKTFTPRQLSAFTSIIISIPIAAGIWFLERSWMISSISLVIIFAGSYLLISFTLQRFIYRKIKLIYKFIYQTKASKREEMYYKYILPQKSIEEVSEDVQAWAVERSLEIDLLRKNEEFRKEFLQNLSHEFKTPVFAIQGYIDTLRDGAMLEPETLKRFLNNASSNVTRLLNLLNDLDEISRLERGEQVLHKQNFIIQELVKQVYDSLSIKSREKQIIFSIKKGCESPLTVFADKEKIRQVIINLVDNSIKYGKIDGHIVASMYPLDEQRILVEISDNGIGIPEKHLERVFERFYRTEEGRSHDVTGSGLGLAISKHIIEAHGQTIHVRSSVEVGTTIGFTLDSKRD
ncbi:MAG: sensor histidine kinase [Chitinophagaceae bacterium]|jgi:two-component system phosphate regulon sensor histidine kinase PhoR|nr:sensor histidine kinase [Chitinophagaceae bacterium]